MTAAELHYLLEAKEAPLTLNVLPPEIHAARRIPGSLNACVYETAFQDEVASLIPDKDSVVVVYGAGGGSLDAQVAAEKLRAAGYSNIGVLNDGIEGWRAAGFPSVGSKRLPSDAVADGTYHLDTAESFIRWTGRSPFSYHEGTVRLSGGEIRVGGGALRAARFVIDMHSIACGDLAEPGLNAMLIGHLKNADFFDVERFPTAELLVKRVEPIADGTVGRPSHRLKGDLTLRGLTRPLEFPAVVAAIGGGGLTGQAQIEIDRTEFGSLYGSGKFFYHLGKHVVNDHVHLHIKIHARRSGAQD